MSHSVMTSEREQSDPIPDGFCWSLPDLPAETVAEMLSDYAIGPILRFPPDMWTIRGNESIGEYFRRRAQEVSIPEQERVLSRKMALWIEILKEYASVEVNCTDGIMIEGNDRHGVTTPDASLRAFGIHGAVSTLLSEAPVHARRLPIAQLLMNLSNLARRDPAALAAFLRDLP